MNKLLLVFLLGSGLTAQIANSQNQPGAPLRVPRGPATLPAAYQGNDTDQPVLQRFDLDFPGGGPRDLVSAIERATGKPLNALVPRDAETLALPPMKLNRVTVPDLFDALRLASQKSERIAGGYIPQGQAAFGGYASSSYTFQTQGRGEDAIWYFRYDKQPSPPDYCKFYQLAEDLQNYSIQDITTAIQTGWKMLGITSPPQLKFHPETKLLIGVGHMEELATIDSVLLELRKAPKRQDPVQKKDGTPAKQ